MQVQSTFVAMAMLPDMNPHLLYGSVLAWIPRKVLVHAGAERFSWRMQRERHAGRFQETNETCTSAVQGSVCHEDSGMRCCVQVQNAYVGACRNRHAARFPEADETRASAV